MISDRRKSNNFTKFYHLPPSRGLVTPATWPHSAMSLWNCFDCTLLVVTSLGRTHRHQRSPSIIDFRNYISEKVIHRKISFFSVNYLFLLFHLNSVGNIICLSLFTCSMFLHSQFFGLFAYDRSIR